jgi:hypothetical protein
MIRKETGAGRVSSTRSADFCLLRYALIAKPHALWRRVKCNAQLTAEAQRTLR